MKLKTIIVSATITLLSTTTFSMAETTNITQASKIIESEETWFGDAYEEDGCFCD